MIRLVTKAKLDYFRHSLKTLEALFEERKAIVAENHQLKLRVAELEAAYTQMLGLQLQASEHAWVSFLRSVELEKRLAPLDPAIVQQLSEIVHSGIAALMLTDERLGAELAALKKQIGKAHHPK